MRNNKGAVSVLLCVIFISIIIVIGAAVDVSSLSVANAYAKRMNYMACSSVLAEYDRNLYKDYGLIAYNCSMGDVETKAERYLDLMKRKKDDGIDQIALFDVELDEMKVSCKENLRNNDIFMEQIKEVMKYRLLEAGTDEILKLIDAGIGISDLFKDAEKGLEEEAAQADTDNAFSEDKAIHVSYDSEFINEVDAYVFRNILYAEGNSRPLIKCGIEEEKQKKQDMAGAGNELSEEESKSENEGRRPLKVNNSSFNAEDDSVDRVLKSQRIIDSLPSGNNAGGTVVNGFGFDSEDDILNLARESAGFLDMLNSVVDAGEERIAMMGYIRLYTKNAINYDSFKKDSFFRNETEYVLKGRLSDKSNRAAVKRDLYLLRTALNIAYIYSDSEKRRMTLEMAASLGAGPYASAVQFLIITAWAGAEAAEDISTLYDGGKVPFFKDSASWKLDMDSIFSGSRIISGGNKVEKGIGYSDYLQILLLTCSRQTITERTMDIIQINMKGRYDIQFDLRNCVTDFTEEAKYRRISHVPEILPQVVEDNFMEVKGEFSYSNEEEK